MNQDVGCSFRPKPKLITKLLANLSREVMIYSVEESVGHEGTRSPTEYMMLGCALRRCWSHELRCLDDIGRVAGIG